jgi:hypothetical protein
LAKATAAAREQQQERAREAELERLVDVAALCPEPAVRLAVDGVEAAGVDDLVNPGGQAQCSERNGSSSEADADGARKRDGRRIRIGGRAMCSRPQAATKTENAQEHDRLRVVELILAKIAAEVVRLGNLQIEGHEGVQEKGHAA